MGKRGLTMLSPFWIFTKMRQIMIGFAFNGCETFGDTSHFLIIYRISWWTDIADKRGPICLTSFWISMNKRPHGSAVQATPLPCPRKERPQTSMSFNNGPYCLCSSWQLSQRCGSFSCRRLWITILISCPMPLLLLPHHQWLRTDRDWMNCQNSKPRCSRKPRFVGYLAFHHWKRSPR